MPRDNDRDDKPGGGKRRGPPSRGGGGGKGPRRPGSGPRREGDDRRSAPRSRSAGSDRGGAGDRNKASFKGRGPARDKTASGERTPFKERTPFRDKGTFRSREDDARSERPARPSGGGKRFARPFADERPARGERSDRPPRGRSERRDEDFQPRGRSPRPARFGDDNPRPRGERGDRPERRDERPARQGRPSEGRRSEGFARKPSRFNEGESRSRDERSRAPRFGNDRPRQDRPRDDRPREDRAWHERPARDGSRAPARSFDFDSERLRRDLTGERPRKPRDDEQRSRGPRDDRDRPRRPREGDERPQRGRFGRDERPGFSPRPRREGFGDRPRKPREDFGDRPARGRSRDDNAGRDRPRFEDRGRGPREDRPFGARGGREEGERKPLRSSRTPRREAPPQAPRRADKTGDRIAKVLARAGLCSRRDAEAWIRDGRVALNGRVITSPALDVLPGDRVTVDGAPLPARERTRLFLYHKPKGLVTTHADPEGRPTVFEQLPDDLPRLISIGRLDYNTEGLLLLTNDGGLARALELPQTGWLRRYRVRAHGEVSQDQLNGLKDGITIDGIRYGEIEASLDRTQGANVWLTFAIREGKNREVRNVLAHLGLDVNRLIRMSYGPFQLGELPEGAVEEVPSRVLRDQLGEKLVALSGADFESAATPRADDAGERPQRRRKAGEGDGARRTRAGLVADSKGRRVLVERRAKPDDGEEGRTLPRGGPRKARPYHGKGGKPGKPGGKRDR